jgi:hypothetical protein
MQYFDGNFLKYHYKMSKFNDIEVKKHYLKIKNEKIRSPTL